MEKNQNAPKSQHAFVLCEKSFPGSPGPGTGLEFPRVPEKASKPRKESGCKLGPRRGNS